MSKKTTLKIDDYEKGLLIFSINKALFNNDLSPDDIEALNRLKEELQSSR